MKESQKPLNMILQGAILTIIGIIIIFMAAMTNSTIFAFLVSMFLGLCFGGIGIIMLRQGYRLIKKIETEVKMENGEKS